MQTIRTQYLVAAALGLALGVLFATSAHAADKKPNILIIWGDDIGYWNVSAYNQGMMGYRTPNIDRLAKEGAIFTDYYGQQSCTAGRAAFITGQTPFRTGLLKVGLPGAKEGLQKEDPTLADLLKAQGYMTGQFGKNHLGDRDEHLPTAHGFDEFFGSLYHLNAEDEPEHPDYPKNPEFRKKFGPRGVLHTVTRPAARPSRYISTATTRWITSPGKPRAPARSFSTSTTTARWWRCVTTNTSSSSLSSAHTASMCGRIRS